MTSLTKEVARAARRQAARRRALEELLRPRPGVVDVHPADRADARVDREALRQQRAGAAANRAAFLAGYNFGETTEAVGHRFEVRPATLPAGEYTSITGNTALAWGIVAAGQLAKLPVTLGSYPITPASDILHELSKHKHFGVRTVQAEDEIAAVGMALGAAFAGHLGVTTTSGPGLALKSETISLAVSLELPLLIVDIQRGGPSTGLPTKTEAADLNIALFGRHGEAPLPVVAAYSPAHCFDAAIEAVRIAVKYRTPVILLSDGYLANGSEPWRLPDVDDAARHLGAVRHRAEPHRRRRQPGVLAVPARPRHARPAVGDPRHARADAPHRRHREGGRHRQHLLHAGEPPADGRPAGRQGRRASPTTSRRSRSSGDADAELCVARLGLDVGRHRRRRAAPAPRRPQGGVGPPHPPQPAAERPRRHRCGASRKVLVPELNTRPAAPASCAPSTSSTPSRCQQGRRACRSPPARSRTRSTKELRVDD